MQVQNVIFMGFRGPKALEDRLADSQRHESAPAGCAEHVRQLGGESPLPNLMEVKG